MRRQAAEVARLADALIARPARQLAGVHRLGDAGARRATAPIGPAASARTARRSARASSRRRAAGRCRRRCRAPRARAARAARRARTRRTTARWPRARRRGAPRASAITRPAASRSDGPDVTTTRRPRIAGGQRGGQLDEGAAGHRRNGLPALTWMTTSAIVGGDAARAPAASRDRGAAAASTGISTGNARAVGRRDAERREQIPLVLDRVPRPQRARPRDPPRVHPAAAGDRRSRCARARRSATSAATRAGRRESRSPGRSARARSRRPSARSPSRPRSAARARRDDDLVQMRVADDDRRRRRLDEVGEVRVGKPLPQRADGRAS